MLAGQSLTCTTAAVTTSAFGGGGIGVTADYAGQVAETNEGNNSQTGGTFQVVPIPPDESQNEVVTWPAGGSFVCGAVGGSPCYAWKDHSNIEKTLRVTRSKSSA